MLSIIVAMDQNGVIGRNNDLPWHLPNDLKYFKKTTEGKTVVMGRKCYESIGRPLPKRKNIVLSRTAFIQENVDWYSCIDEVLDLPEEVFIIGGSQIYKALLPFCNRLYITKIHHEFEGDTFFPNIDLSEWLEVSKEKGIIDDKNIYEHDFYIYEKP